jgi:hypothetical protein
VIAGNRGFHVFESDPGVVGELFENPNARAYAYGHGFVDRGYVIKWWTNYAAPSYAMSAVARYQDGQPFSRLAIVPDLNQGPEAINGYRLGRTRFTFTFTLDTHFEKTFSIGRARRRRHCRGVSTCSTRTRKSRKTSRLARPSAIRPLSSRLAWLASGLGLGCDAPDFTSSSRWSY